MPALIYRQKKAPAPAPLRVRLAGASGAIDRPLVARAPGSCAGWAASAWRPLGTRPARERVGTPGWKALGRVRRRFGRGDTAGRHPEHRLLAARRSLPAPLRFPQGSFGSGALARHAGSGPNYGTAVRAGPCIVKKMDRITPAPPPSAYSGHALSRIAMMIRVGRMFNRRAHCWSNFLCIKHHAFPNSRTFCPPFCPHAVVSGSAFRRPRTGTL